MSVRFIITFTSSVFAALLGSLVFVSFLLARNQGELEASEERRHQSYKLADELRQTSDDLTRLARTYVVTGDPVFEGYFQEVIRIRNGEAPRPDHYDGIYWDFVLATGRRQGSSEGPVALEVLMKRMHFTEEEFLKLKESKAKSDALVHLEEKAMNAVKGRFNDAAGEPSVVREPDLEMARGLVFGKEYHQAKAEIMKPISEFMVMLDERTEREVRALQKKPSPLRDDDPRTRGRRAGVHLRGIPGPLPACHDPGPQARRRGGRRESRPLRPAGRSFLRG